MSTFVHAFFPFPQNRSLSCFAGDSAGHTRRSGVTAGRGIPRRWRPSRVGAVLSNGKKTRGVAMPTTRLSPLDASFLAVESPTAHMHVGWAASFRPPDGNRPSFGDLFDHIAGRLSRGRRFRQRLAHVPLSLNAPLWIDDQSFDPAQPI